MSTPNTVPIRPRVGVFSVFEAVDYKVWFALAEFVDNSIQSHLDARRAALPFGHGRLEIRIEVGTGPASVIRIQDNAAGIASARLATAFEVGSPPADTSGLSVYGIGMKSAAAWFADKCEISTSAYGEPVESTVTFDFLEIVERGIERLPVLQRAVDPTTHGTSVLLSGLRNPIQTRAHAKVRSHLASIYRNFLRTGAVRILYQGEELAYADPEVLVAPYFRDPRGRSVEWRKEISITLSSGEHIAGFAAIRKVGRAAGSGFSLYRSHRVITGLEDDPWRPSEIFGYGNSYRSQRLFGELHLENVKVAYSKNAFVWQASEEELVERLREALDEDPLPLLRQAEGYRAREPEPRQREAAKRALNDAASAIGSALQKDVPERLSRNPDEEHPPQKSGMSEELVSRRFEVDFRGQHWIVDIEIVEEAGGDWLTIVDEPSDQSSSSRSLKIRLNINSNYMRRFGGRDRVEAEALVRLAVGIALSVAVTREQGFRFGDYFLQHLNGILRGSLST
jgi:hypothetical protein